MSRVVNATCNAMLEDNASDVGWAEGGAKERVKRGCPASDETKYAVKEE